MQPELRLATRPDSVASASGEWTAAYAAECLALIRRAEGGKAPALDGSGIGKLDTTGAYFLTQLQPKEYRGFSADHAVLLKQAMDAEEAPAEDDSSFLLNVPKAYAERVSAFIYKAEDGLAFAGELLVRLAGIAFHPGRLRLRAIVAQGYATGVTAAPLIALISFLIAIVLSYQGSAQLARFGAQIYTVDLVAISVLREMGVLLTAIMIAGRSGSAFAAEIGVMKLNEEIDALKVTGLEPMLVLVLPRIIALIIMVPVLTMLANLCGLTGAGVMSVLRTGLTPTLFLERLYEAVKLNHFWAGMIKAPVFGLLIGLVGCFHGMRVSTSAESVGKETTSSVVHAIFLVILADALFSIVFTELGL